MRQANDGQGEQVKLLVLEPDGRLQQEYRHNLINLFQENDVVIANAASTLPANLTGTHVESGESIELRLAGWETLGDYSRFRAIVFGRGDYRTPTEDRPPPPVLAVNDQFVLGPLTGVITRQLDHPRLITVDFIGEQETIVAGIAHHGQPIQYAHVQNKMALCDVWTDIAACPIAFEPPSAGFALDWTLLQNLIDRGIGFGTLQHAAGLSSTGSLELDQQLPLDEHYFIPAITADLVNGSKEQGGRIIAIGTTVMRALEAAWNVHEKIQPGAGIARNHIDRQTKICCVDALLTGIHPPGVSHHELMGSLVNDIQLNAIDLCIAEHQYREHEFGDLLFIQGVQESEHQSIIID